MAGWSLAEYNKKKAAETRDEIRRIMIECPGISRQEVAERIGMSRERVGDHIQAIRAEWRERA